jgi:hypothetical protein
MPVDLLLTRMKNAPKRWKKREQERKERIKLKKSGEVDKSGFSKKYIKEMEERQKKKKKVNPKNHKIPGEFSGTKEEFNKKYGLDKKDVKEGEKKGEQKVEKKDAKKTQYKQVTKDQLDKKIKERSKPKVKPDPLKDYRRGKGTKLGKDTRITKHLKKSGWTEDRLAAKRKAHAEWKANRKKKKNKKGKLKIGG